MGSRKATAGGGLCVPANNYMKMKNILYLALGLVFGSVFTGVVFAESDIYQRLAGRIVLQVEKNGEAWYINPDTHQRHYLGRPSDAFGVMRNLGLGIADHDLEKFTIASSLSVAKTDGGQSSGGVMSSGDQVKAGTQDKETDPAILIEQCKNYAKERESLMEEKSWEIINKNSAAWFESTDSNIAAALEKYYEPNVGIEWTQEQLVSLSPVMQSSLRDTERQGLKNYVDGLEKQKEDKMAEFTALVETTKNKAYDLSYSECIGGL